MTEQEFSAWIDSLPGRTATQDEWAKTISFVDESLDDIKARIEKAILARKGGEVIWRFEPRWPPEARRSVHVDAYRVRVGVLA
jgi:hypothetical protein